MTNRQLKYSEAVLEALDICLERDRSTYLLGLGVPDPIGVFGTTRGLQEKHGPKRVLDMPVAENAMTGVALGSCLVGMRPVLSHMRLEFAIPSMDQICNQAAKWHFMFGGRAKIPMTIRMLIGRGWGQGPQHSKSPHAWFAHVPGLRVAMPATAFDAKGLLLESIFGENPVLMVEHRALYALKARVPAQPYRIRFGQAAVRRAGEHISLVAVGAMVPFALRVADLLAEHKVRAEVLDLRTVSPLDIDGICR